MSVLQVIRDYDEEEQGYDSEREEEREGSPDMAASPHATDDAGRGESDQHSDEQQDEDMDMSDWRHAHDSDIAFKKKKILKNLFM